MCDRYFHLITFIWDVTNLIFLTPFMAHTHAHIRNPQLLMAAMHMDFSFHENRLLTSVAFP